MKAPLGALTSVRPVAGEGTTASFSVYRLSSKNIAHIKARQIKYKIPLLVLDK